MLRIAVFALPAALAAAENRNIEFATIKREVVEARLERLSRKIGDRRTNLEELFQQAGCTAAAQAVKGEKLPNVICSLPAESESAIVVGAHYDFFEARGMGALDNWSGASLLPSLYEALEGRPRRHKFVFVGFTAEEKGLNGSTWYARHLSGEERSRVRAYINLDSLGLGPPMIWTSRSDPKLAGALVKVARALGIEIAGVNVEQVGDDDSHSFARVKIPVVSIHSVTQQTLPILHSFEDQLRAIRRDDHYDTCKLVSAYLAYLDGWLD